MGGTGRKTNREGAFGEIETVDLTRFGDRRHRIDDNDEGETAPVLDQGESITAPFEDADARRNPPTEPPGDRRPKAVVAAVRVADRGDESQGTINAAHVRCTCSFRKCAAQEMQGSWLRMVCSHRAFSVSSWRASPAVATSRRSSSMTS